MAKAGTAQSGSGDRGSTAPSGGPGLRVAYLWGTDVQAEDVYEAPREVVLGSGPDTLFALPDGVLPGERNVMFRPNADGRYALQLDPRMQGDLFLLGDRKSVSDLAANRSEVAVTPGDYGVVTMGSTSIFFQYVAPARKPPRHVFSIDWGLITALMLTLFFVLYLGIGMLFFWPRAFGTGLDSQDLSQDLLVEYLVTPPPEPIEERFKRESGTETEDPGFRSRDEASGTAHKNDMGRVGRQDSPQENTEIEGEVTTEVAARVREQGLLGALAGGGEENAIAAALDVPDLGDILGGMGSAQTILGRGSGGTGLLGQGSGGGGEGNGSLFGAGKIGTGAGAGRGRGMGRGQGGAGAPGKARERVVSVQRGSPSVSGYLSAEQINRVVRANSSAIRYCYEVEVQRQPNLRGRVVVNWRINLQGAVTSARIANSSLRNASVEGCMTRQIRRWRFPQPDGGEVQVAYPFIFGVQGG